MAVVWAKQVRSRSLGVNDKLERKGQRVYRVLCYDRDDGPELAEAECPALGESWSDDFPGLVVTAVDSREVEAARDGVLYEVTIDYGTTTADPEQEGSESDPCDRPPVLRLSFDSFEETIYEQKDATPTAADAAGGEVSIGSEWVWGKAICNSAGTPTPINETYTDPCITYSRNVRTSDFTALWALLVSFANAVNSDTFRIKYRGQTLKIDPGTAWIADITSEPGYENQVQYETVTVTIKVRADGWRRKVQDQGLCAYLLDNPSTDKPPEHITVKGEKVSEPVPLNGKGAKLGSSAKPVFLSFKTKDTKAFQPLFTRLAR